MSAYLPPSSEASPTTRYHIRGLPRHPKGSFSAYLRESKISFKRLHDHGASAHVSIADQDVEKFMALGTFFGKEMIVEVARPTETKFEHRISYVVVAFASEQQLSDKLDEMGYAVKIRITAPKSEAAKSYKLVALKTSEGVKVRALAAFKHLTTDSWVAALREGSAVFSVTSMFAAGSVIDDFGLGQDVEVFTHKTDQMTWLTIRLPSDGEAEDEADGEAQDGGQTEDEADDLVIPVVPKKRR